MTWTAQQRRKYQRALYHRLYKAPARVGSSGRPIIVPDDIRREQFHEPCFLCGSARECAHRRLG
jgi:hypothetical protein